MSDAGEALAKALGRTKQLAAARRVRKEELEAELARRRGERAGLEGMSGAEADALKADLDARIQAVAGELGAVDGELRGALKEIAELERLAREQPAAEARRLVAEGTDPDPVLRSAEEMALDNVRSHIADLDAQTHLADELKEDSPSPPVKPKKTM